MINAVLMNKGKKLFPQPKPYYLNRILHRLGWERGDLNGSPAPLSHKKVQEMIDKKLCRIAQLEVYEWIEKKASSDPKRLGKIPSNYCIKDAVKIFLVWMLYEGSLQYLG